MNKQESQNLMIGSWVLAGGEPRQVCSLTTKKAGFKRGTSGHRDFFRFDQLQGIPLSEELLKECVTYRPTGKPQHLDHAISIHCYSVTVIAVRIDCRTTYYRFRYLHEVQSFLLSTYQLQVQFDVEKYKEVAADRIPYESPKVLLGQSLVDRLRGIGTRPCACNPSISGIPDLGKDERGLQKGMLTYED